MSIYLGVGDKAKKPSKLYLGVGDKAKVIKKAYLGVGGKAKLIYSSGTPISGKAVGSIVKIKVNGVDRDFIVVHHGLPSSDYDSSCNGTWLLQRFLYDKVAYNESFYENSNMHSYMTNTFFPQLDTGMQNIVKQVKIPFRDNKGSKGLSTKAFELAAVEVGLDAATSTDSGAKLSYFSDNDSRIAYDTSGKTDSWWLRSRYYNIFFGYEMYYVYNTGILNYSKGTIYVRPCIIVPFETLVDDDGYIVT